MVLRLETCYADEAAYSHKQREQTVLHTVRRDENTVFSFGASVWARELQAALFLYNFREYFLLARENPLIGRASRLSKG